jgi:hypothetical protein
LKDGCGLPSGPNGQFRTIDLTAIIAGKQTLPEPGPYLTAVLSAVQTIRMSSALPTKAAVPSMWSVVARPTMLFVAAYALNSSPHEATHALVAYALGFNSTLFQMWVNPDAAAASPGKLAIIAASGPLFSLAVGTVCGLLYWSVYRSRSAGLFLLMMSLIGIYFFLGPVVGASFGGDFQAALEFINAPRSVRLVATALGIVLLAFWMFCMGEELTRWVPSQADRTVKVLATTVAPWLIGVAFVALLYWPLPRSLLGSTLSGSVFWIFAVVGALYRTSAKPSDSMGFPMGWPDAVVLVSALLLVRILALGIRITHGGGSLL